MTVSELNSKIAVINADSKRINNERQINIGKRETLTKQLNDALAQYSNTYGVSLTVDNLDEEIERVSSLKEAEVQSVSQMLDLIKQGKYDEANKLVSENSEEHSAVAEEVPTPPVIPQAQTVVPEPQTIAPQTKVVTPEPQISQNVEAVSTPVQTVVPPVQPVTSPTQTVVPPVVAPPVAPVPQNTAQVTSLQNDGFSMPSPSPKLSGLDMPKAPSLSGLDMPEPVGAPPKLGTPPTIPTPPSPKPSQPITSFGAILGGTAFNPQN